MSVPLRYRLELLSSHPNLQVLRLTNNGMGPAGGEMLAGALLANAQRAKAEGRKPALRTIVCGKFPLLLQERLVGCELNPRIPVVQAVIASRTAARKLLRTRSPLLAPC